jgi:hypothetical protein
VPNANSYHYRSKAAEYGRLTVEAAALPISDDFRRAQQTYLALARREEWLSRGTLTRDPQWADGLAPSVRKRWPPPSLVRSVGRKGSKN